MPEMSGIKTSTIQTLGIFVFLKKY